METTTLCSLLYYFILESPFMICANAVFTEVPKDVSVGEGEDVEMPCAFKAAGSVPVSLEIQWWYLKEDVSKELPVGIPANGSKVIPSEATKISTVRVQGSAISHRLSLSKVKKEDEGLYECHVSDLRADDTREFAVGATLHVTPGDSMVAEEAVSHIQNRLPPRDTDAGAADPAAGPRLGRGKHRVPQQTQPGLIPSISTTITTSGAKSSASPLLGNTAILGLQHGAGCSPVRTMDPLLGITLLFLHNLLPFLLTH